MTNNKRYDDEKRQGESLFLDTDNRKTRKLFIENYGCQMNFSDSEIVASILADEGFNTTRNLEEADLVLVNGDPLNNIDDVLNIVAVVRNGRFFSVVRLLEQAHAADSVE